MQDTTEELDKLNYESVHVMKMKNECEEQKRRSLELESEMEVIRAEGIKAQEEMMRQQTLYNELKKMRGRGEEIELLQQTKQVINRQRMINVLIYYLFVSSTNIAEI